MNNITVQEKLYLQESWDSIKAWIETEGKVSTYDTSLDCTYKTLINLYSDPRREYHNLKHIISCLKLLKQINPDSFHTMIAIWFHDCIYTFTSGHDERMSQEILFSSLGHFKIPGLSNISRMIELTTGHTNPITQDEKLFVDIDLSILGSESGVYKEYSKAIFNEFKNFHPVPEGLNKTFDDMFKHGRIAFLKDMLGRSSIYKSQACKNRFESEARFNILTEINELEENGQVS